MYFIPMLDCRYVYLQSQIFSFPGNIGRPKSENHGSQGDILTSGSRRSSSGNKKPGLNGNNGNPFQDDQTQVWQPRNSSNLSSPEVLMYQ